jgi:very-short-patch-repair endonuclease
MQMPPTKETGKVSPLPLAGRGRGGGTADSMKPAHHASDHMIKRSRGLRNNATEGERWLWYRLRRLRKFGYHFRRQSPFDQYVLDFVCHDEKIVVELDGDQHLLPANQKRDAIRDRFLQSRGYRTVRIPSWWANDDPDHVGDLILKQLSGAESATPTPTPPRKGEGVRKPRTLRSNKSHSKPKPPMPALSADPTSPHPLAGRGRGGGTGTSARTTDDRGNEK